MKLLDSRLPNNYLITFKKLNIIYIEVNSAV